MGIFSKLLKPFKKNKRTDEPENKTSFNSPTEQDKKETQDLDSSQNSSIRTRKKIRTSALVNPIQDLEQKKKVTEKASQKSLLDTAFRLDDVERDHSDDELFANIPKVTKSNLKGKESIIDTDSKSISSDVTVKVSNKAKDASANRGSKEIYSDLISSIEKEYTLDKDKEDKKSTDPKIVKKLAKLIYANIDKPDRKDIKAKLNESFPAKDVKLDDSKKPSARDEPTPELKEIDFYKIMEETRKVQNADLERRQEQNKNLKTKKPSLEFKKNPPTKKVGLGPLFKQRPFILRRPDSKPDAVSTPEQSISKPPVLKGRRDEPTPELKEIDFYKIMEETRKVQNADLERRQEQNKNLKTKKPSLEYKTIVLEERKVKSSKLQRPDSELDAVITPEQIASKPPVLRRRRPEPEDQETAKPELSKSMQSVENIEPPLRRGEPESDTTFIKPDSAQLKLADEEIKHFAKEVNRVNNNDKMNRDKEHLSIQQLEESISRLSKNPENEFMMESLRKVFPFTPVNKDETQFNQKQSTPRLQTMGVIEVSSEKKSHEKWRKGESVRPNTDKHISEKWPKIDDNKLEQRKKWQNSLAESIITPSKDRGVV